MLGQGSCRTTAWVPIRSEIAATGSRCGLRSPFPSNRSVPTAPSTPMRSAGLIPVRHAVPKEGIWTDSSGGNLAIPAGVGPGPLSRVEFGSSP